jgi:hypothetical protein
MIGFPMYICNRYINVLYIHVFIPGCRFYMGLYLSTVFTDYVYSDSWFYIIMFGKLHIIWWYISDPYTVRQILYGPVKFGSDWSSQVLQKNTKM